MTSKTHQLAINTLRINGVSAVNRANSGHPGIVLGAAPMLHTLFCKHLVYDPKHPTWVNRDRFILSAGHGSALLYAMLRIIGLMSEAELKDFRKIHAHAAGHPERDVPRGIEATTGPLGQGIAMGVGIALAEAHLHARFQEINHYTYVICGDGDLQEGVANEAFSFAGHNKLNKLIVLHDSNQIQLDSEVKATFSELLQLKMTAMHWNYIFVAENTMEAIDRALDAAKVSDRPTFIEIRTVIGEGATKANTSEVHGAPLGADLQNVKAYYGWEDDEFALPPSVKELYEQTLFARGQTAHQSFKASPNLEKFLSLKPTPIAVDLKPNEATRNTSGAVINHLNQTMENWIGGSADLSGSTKAKGPQGNFSFDNRLGRNIMFGVREFAMAAIGNGLALHSNLRPFVSTFLVFADYLKPAIRLAAIMKLPTIFIFTHDSIFVGEDGPTHEPIEQNAMLRAIPNVDFVRPADENEVLGAYELALKNLSKPTIIALTRQNIKSLQQTSKDLVQKGAYQLQKTTSPWSLLASGSELANAYEIGQELGLNVYSISNAKFLDDHPWDHRYAISIEALSTFGMAHFAKFNFGINRFGLSGKGELIYEYFQLDKPNLKKRIEAIIKQHTID